MCIKEEQKKLSIRKSIAWNTWGNLLYYGVQWVATILIVRILGYSEAGIYSLAMSITNSFAAVAGYGMRNYQVSDIENKYNSNEYIKSRIFTEIIAFVLCFGAVLIKGYPSRTKLIILVYMVFRLSEASFDMISAFFQRAWRLDLLGRSLTIKSFLFFTLFTITAYLSKSILTTVIIIAIVMNLVVIVYDCSKLKNLVNVSESGKMNKTILLLTECTPLALYSFMSSSIATIPRYFLEDLMGSKMLGIYASIAAPTLIIQLIANNIFAPILTAMAESLVNKNTEEFIRFIRKCIIIIFTLTIVSLIGVLAFGEIGLRLLFGAEIIQYMNLLIPLVFCTVSTALLWLLSGVATVIRDFKGLIISNFIALSVALLLSKWFINKYLLLGASYVLLFANTIGIISLMIVILLDVREIEKY